MLHNIKLNISLSFSQRFFPIISFIISSDSWIKFFSWSTQQIIKIAFVLFITSIASSSRENILAILVQFIHEFSKWFFNDVSMFIVLGCWWLMLKLWNNLALFIWRVELGLMDRRCIFWWKVRLTIALVITFYLFNNRTVRLVLKGKLPLINFLLELIFLFFFFLSLFILFCLFNSFIKLLFNFANRQWIILLY